MIPEDLRKLILPSTYEGLKKGGHLRRCDLMCERLGKEVEFSPTVLNPESYALEKVVFVDGVRVTTFPVEGDLTETEALDLLFARIQSAGRA
jgi:hypothetical protein